MKDAIVLHTNTVLLEIVNKTKIVVVAFHPLDNSWLPNNIKLQIHATHLSFVAGNNRIRLDFPEE